MDAAQKIPKRVILLLRARRALLALCVSLFLLLGLQLLRRVLDFPLPWGLALLVPLVLVLSFVGPLPVRWVRVGRRLGLGGKLAGLVAALASNDATFMALLAPHISLRPWRLFLPELFALLPVFVLASLLFGLPGERPQPELLPPGAPLAAPEVAAPEPSISAPAEREQERKPAPARAIPELPPGFPAARSPYEEILAELLGMEVPPEEVWARLAQEEGLLRRLAEVLREAVTQGVTEEIRAEFAELVSELARPDLRSALSSALGEEENLAEAQAIVAEALRSLEALQEEAASGGGSEAQAQGSGGPEASSAPEPARAQAFGSGEVLMDTEAEERREARLGEGEEGLGAGWEEGEPVRPGLVRPAPQIEEVLPVPVRTGEGPVRRGFALGLPGEAPGAEPESAPLPSPQEVELVLRAKDLPPGLRDVVRRYFQLLVEGGGS